MADRRTPNERYEAIGRELVESEACLAHIDMSEARIAYLSSDARKRSKGRAVLGQCEKIPEKYQWALPYDFTITVFEPNVLLLDEGQLRTLLLHELLHVGVEWDDDGGERYRIVGHDFEDFREVVGRFGADWQRCRGGGEPAEDAPAGAEG